MSTDSHEPRPFDCPDCGHHHKADLHGMVGHPEVHGKVPCASCGKTLWLSLDEQGQALVELYEEHLHEAIHKERIAAHQAKQDAEAALAANAGTHPGGAPSGGGPSLFMSAVAAAIVAAVVSLAMGGSKGADPADPGDQGPTEQEARMETLAQELAGLKDAAEGARTEGEQIRGKLAELDKMFKLQAGAARASAGGDPALLAVIQQKTLEFTKALEALQGSYKSLHGRIEGNYTALRQLDKRLDKLEAK